MFEAAAIDVTDGTHPWFPFFAHDFEQIERTIMIKFIKNKYLTTRMFVTY